MNNQEIHAFPHPRDASVFIGHKQQQAQFIQSVNSGRLHHFWLFLGPKGVGKLTFAYRCARLLFSAPSFSGIDDGGGERDFSRQSARDVDATFASFKYPPDLMEIGTDDTTETIRAEQVRDIARFFRSTKDAGQWRIVVLEIAQPLNDHSANALLKITEEPPGQCLVIVTCHNSAHVPATLVSRARRLSFRPLARLELDEAMRHIALDAWHRLDDTQRELVAWLSCGSPGVACNMLVPDNFTQICEMNELLKSQSGQGRVISNLCEWAGKDAKNLGLFIHVLGQCIRQRVLNEVAQQNTAPEKLSEFFLQIEKQYRLIATYNLDRRAWAGQLLRIANNF